MTFRKSLHGLAALTLIAAAAPLTETLAQEDSQDTAAQTQEIVEVIVTARKQSERLLDTPVAVTALTSTDIERRGIASVAALAAYTPSLNVSNNASGRNDRSFQQVILRGMTPSHTTAQTTSIFINGIPVTSATLVNSIDDPAHIEILKGPQSAYFGRQTFAGAVNVVTKTPASEWGGDVSVMVGTRDNRDVRLALEGPVFSSSDKMSFRATYRRFERDGSYVNGASGAAVLGQHLGNQSSQIGTLALEARPTDALSIKVLGMLIEDEDGPSAQGWIGPAQSNCTVGATNQNQYYCGTAPDLLPGFPAQNTALTPNNVAVLASGAGRIMAPKDGVQGYGLYREAHHVGLVMDYQLPVAGLALSSLTGWNGDRYSQVADLDNRDTSSLPNTAAAIAAGGPSYFDYPYLIERNTTDFSQELRLSSDPGQRFRYQFGASYLESLVRSDLGGGNFGLRPSVTGPTRVRTKGAFFGLSYEITPKLTANIDGRYQVDTVIGYNKPAISDAILAKVTAKEFLPRFIAQYQFTPDIMGYASYAKGVMPGNFNAQVLNLTPSQQTALLERFGASLTVAPEKLTSYELGLKTRFLDGRATLASAAYYYRWTNQVNSITAFTPSPIPGANDVGVVVSMNNGDVTLKGVEAELSLIPVEHLTLEVSGSVNDSHINEMGSASLTTLTGWTDFSGKQMPSVSKYSASLGAQYSNTLANGAGWFVRADYSFKAGVYDTHANLVKTPDWSQVNVNAGIAELGHLDISAFVTNVFNDKSYTSIAPQYFIHPTQSNFSTYGTLIVGLPTLRTYGVKVRYRF